MLWVPWVVAPALALISPAQWPITCTTEGLITDTDASMLWVPWFVAPALALISPACLHF